MKTKILIAVTALFFGVMLALTFSARAIHTAMIPHVKYGRLQKQDFPSEVTDENGNTIIWMDRQNAITTEQRDKGVYVLYSEERNGEKRDFIRRVEVETGEEYNGYVMVLSGIDRGDKIIIESDRELADGEVYVIK